jgi:hypothetical protein
MKSKRKQEETSLQFNSRCWGEKWEEFTSDPNIVSINEDF